MRESSPEAEIPWVLWPIHQLEPTTLRPLRDAAAREGFRFLERLQDDWLAGRNRFDEPGECLLGWWHHGRLGAVGGVNRMAPGHYRLRRLYVAPRWRRQGVGRMLVAVLLAHVAAKGDGRVVLRTDTAEGAAFNERLGFTRLAEHPDATHLRELPGTEEAAAVGCTEHWTCVAGRLGEARFRFLADRRIDDPMHLQHSEWVELFGISTLARQWLARHPELDDLEFAWRPVAAGGYALESHERV